MTCVEIMNAHVCGHSGFVCAVDTEGRRYRLLADPVVQEGREETQDTDTACGKKDTGQRQREMKGNAKERTKQEGKRKGGERAR